MFSIERKVERVAQKTVAFSAAGILCAVGIGFLTAACWIILVELRSPLFAAIILGVLYLGIAALVAAAGMRKPSESLDTEHPRHDDAGLSPMQAVVLSFVQGFERGRKTDRGA